MALGSKTVSYTLAVETKEEQTFANNLAAETKEEQNVGKQLEMIQKIQKQTEGTTRHLIEWQMGNMQPLLNQIRLYRESFLSLAPIVSRPDISRYFDDLNLRVKGQNTRPIQRISKIAEKIHQDDSSPIAKIDELTKTVSELQKEIMKISKTIYPNSSKEKPRKDRLNESPREKESLNAKIVKRAWKLYYDGDTKSWATVYEECSKNSEKLFGKSLSPKQIEGRYQRNKKKYKDYCD